MMFAVNTYDLGLFLTDFKANLPIHNSPNEWNLSCKSCKRCVSSARLSAKFQHQCPLNAFLELAYAYLATQSNIIRREEVTADNSV